MSLWAGMKWEELESDECSDHTYTMLCRYGNNKPPVGPQLEVFRGITV